MSMPSLWEQNTLRLSCLASSLALSSCGVVQLPLRAMTPGAVQDTSAAVVCSYGYARAHRPPYDAEWRAFRVMVFRRYEIPHADWSQYRLDHLVPLELGGAGEDLANVWPQPVDESKVKDWVESALYRRVCYDHALGLREAQEQISADWRSTEVGMP